MTAIRPLGSALPGCTSSEPYASLAGEPVPRSLVLRKVLVATDGRSPADGALRVAAALGARHGAAVEEAATYEPRIPIPFPRDMDERVEEAERPELTALASRVHAQCRRVAGEGAEWPLHMAAGYPAAMVERIARRERVDLVLAGIGPCTPEDRRYSKETALALAFASDVPVLAVACEAYRLPRRAMIVVDRGASAAAVQAAVQLVDDVADVYLAYVRRAGDDPVHGSSWALERLFGAIEAGAARAGVTFRRLVLDGGPVAAVLHAAQSRGVEMIAAAMPGASVAQRSLIDGIAAPLLRAASCSVLVVPTDPISVPG